MFTISPTMKIKSKLTLISMLLRPCQSYLLPNQASSAVSTRFLSHAFRTNQGKATPTAKTGDPSVRQSTPTSRFLSSGGALPSTRHIGKAEMAEILDDYEHAGREESMYCVIDVRTPDEIRMTGSLGKNVYNIPVETLMHTNALALDDDDFEAEFGFAKPQMDETLVFSCAAGIRSNYACQAAALAGYTNLINYRGGANEWFSNFY
mmetsp:Transcript_17410/g.22632  ORF Transcript_17410/g.22632 Transcript_17410/m.22632 type:complete len:206 (-) Transcript_17410:256-873(-)